MKPTGMIVNGQRVACVKDIYNWNDTGLEFRPGDGARKRSTKTKIDTMVWHWTGGEGGYQQLYHVLDQRELGVEFFIDIDGRIYQFADPVKVDTYDAGPWNSRSVGCEVRNYGYRAYGREVPSIVTRFRRGTYITRMNGHVQEFGRFTAPQIESAMALGEAISAAIPTIPLRVPAATPGKLHLNTFTATQSRAFRGGHVGHYHLTASKLDPGHDLLQAFLDTGRYESVMVT